MLDWLIYIVTTPLLFAADHLMVTAAVVAVSALVAVAVAARGRC